MKKIKVLEVIRQGQIGGGESHLADLIELMDKTVFEPVCLSFTYGEMIHRLEKIGIKCHVVETTKPFNISIQHRIIQIIKKEGIDIIHAHGTRAASNVLYPSLRLKLPLVYTVHGWSFHDDQKRRTYTLRKWSEKLICSLAKRVICVSESNAETGKKVFGLRQCDVIENGINLQRFNPFSTYPNLRSEFGFTANDFIVGFIARNTTQKDPLNFLQAVEEAHKQNPQVKALFVGEGDLDAETNAFIAVHHMQDYLYQSKFRQDVPALLHAIDVYCLPSLWEGLSIALLEAMAMEKAIIATPTDGTKELLTHEKNGLVVPFQSPVDLASAILYFANTPELRERCSVNARKLVAQRFNAQRVADVVGDIYKSII